MVFYSCQKANVILRTEENRKRNRKHDYVTEKKKVRTFASWLICAILKAEADIIIIRKEKNTEKEKNYKL